MENKINHVAIIMDGNGRWAKGLNKPRTFGHNKGANIISDIINFALKDHVKYLTLFAFSIENWNRPQKEVDFIFKLFFKKILSKKTRQNFIKNGIKFKWLGQKENIPNSLLAEIYKVEKETFKNNKLVLTIAFNYGGKQDIIAAAIKSKNVKEFNDNLMSHFLPDVDLLIRTGDEKRISNFLLWQISYSEIIFEKTLWPDYNKQIWDDNLKNYFSRQRRFGEIHNEQ